MLAVVVVVTAAAGLALPPAAHTTPSPLPARDDSEWAGPAWKALSGSAKDAYIRGFLAGAAAEQARVQGRTPDDTAELIRRIGDLHAAHALRFPFAASLYASQLDDFYWWDDHRSVPLISALVVINGQLVSREQ